MCRDFMLFPKAAEALQTAVDQKNARSEMYWRKVFGAFAHIALKRQRWMKEDPWHLYNTAAIYAYGGDNPRYEPDLTQEEETEKLHGSIAASDLHASPSIPDGEDDEIPF